MEINENQMAELLEGVAKKNAQFLEGKLEKIEATLQTQGEALRKAGYSGGARAENPLSTVITEKSLDAVRTGDKRSVSFKVNKTDVTRASVGSSTMAVVAPGVGQLPTLGTRLRGLFRSVPVGPNSNGTIQYFDQATVTRNAATRAENAEKPESAITWIQRECKLEKIADTIPVTREALKDVSFIRGEVERLLTVNLALKEDSQLYSGDGNTPNLAGVYTVAPTWNPAAWTGPSVYDATLYDLLAVLQAEIMNGAQSKYSPNFVMLNPNDMLRLKLAKGSDGHYVLPSFVSQNGTFVSGMEVISSSQVTENTLLIGDSRYGTIYDLEETTIEVGYVNAQFIENAVTILAEKRLGLLIREVDEDAFLKVTNLGLAINTLSYS